MEHSPHAPRRSYPALMGALRKAYNGRPKPTFWDRLSGYAHHSKIASCGPRPGANLILLDPLVHNYVSPRTTGRDPLSSACLFPDDGVSPMTIRPNAARCDGPSVGGTARKPRGHFSPRRGLSARSRFRRHRVERLMASRGAQGGGSPRSERRGQRSLVFCGSCNSLQTHRSSLVLRLVRLQGVRVSRKQAVSRGFVRRHGSVPSGAESFFGALLTMYVPSVAPKRPLQSTAARLASLCRNLLCAADKYSTSAE